jgi:hypothetical protein
MDIQKIQSGRIIDFSDQMAYRIDHNPISRGELLKKYYLSEYSDFMVRIRECIERGLDNLIDFLVNPEWKNLEFEYEPVKINSDAIKMMIVLESIFEHVRRKINPSLPCRMDSIFVWPTLDVARTFKNEYIPGGVIHRCIIREGNGILLDGGLLPPGIDLSDLRKEYFTNEYYSTITRAEKYWRVSSEPTLPELLINGVVHIDGIEEA